jgi:RHS repeat-associated protein
MWGLDLSGTGQAAGGVGGLLMVWGLASGQVTNREFVAYDGNGNVSALVNSTNGAVWGRYDYGPFGEVIRATGPMAKGNPFRFSTKYQDDESDLLYYGYRYYSASKGSWLSRDPLDESGGINLYALADSDSLNKYDPNGREVGEAIAGVAIELGIQLAINVYTGKSWYEIDAKGLLIAGAWGLVGIPGLASAEKWRKVANGACKAGDVNAKMVLKASQIAKLNSKLSKMAEERANALVDAAKAGGTIAAGEAVLQSVVQLAEHAKEGVESMTGCPNPGYSMNTTVNIVQVLVVPIKDWQGPLPSGSPVDNP